MFENFTGKHFFFNKVAGPQNRNFIKKRLQPMVFTMNFVNYP